MSEPDPEDAANWEERSRARRDRSPCWGDDRGKSAQFDKIVSQLRAEIRIRQVVSQLSAMKSWDSPESHD